MLSANCPVQWKSGFTREENTYPKCQTPSNVSICPLKSGYDDELQSGRDLDKHDEHADELPWDGIDDLGGEDAGCVGPGLCGYTWSAVKFSETPLEMAYGREININIVLCDYLDKGEVLTNTDLDRFVNNIWEK